MRPLEGLRILLVEDNPDHLETLGFYLRQFGAQVYGTHTAQEALDGYYSFLPDLVVSDLEMPHVDGYALMRLLRQRGVTVPAIAVSAHSGPDERARSRSAGFQAHVPKPVFPMGFLDAIRSVMPAR
jgi:CheY-like chemotaxis protein